MPFLKLDEVVKRYGSTKVIHGVSLEAAKGEFVVFVGPSGCGKSTLLRMIAGLEEVTDGDVSIDGRVVTDVAPADREVSMVFQSYALYPHMSVFENIAFGLRMAKMPNAEIDDAGQRRRPHPADRAAARAASRASSRAASASASPSAAPSCATRSCSCSTSRSPTSTPNCARRCASRSPSCTATLGVTMVYVTHDQIEAMTLADRIVVLRAGLVEQIGSPTELYDHPANLFVAGFIGSPKMNFIPAKVTAVGDGRRHRSPTAPSPAAACVAPAAGESRLEVGAPVTRGPPARQSDDRRGAADPRSDGGACGKSRRLDADLCRRRRTRPASR